jgi:aminoglycoside phosphotransferase (APT) family kinase protein
MENVDPHIDFVKKVILKQFEEEPTTISRMKTGLSNEVYSVSVKDSDYIVRLNTRDSIKGSSKNIPLFQSKGIKVPGIVAEDYSHEIVPLNWMILDKIPGDDIGTVISDLSEQQLSAIANEIAGIVMKLISIPTNGLFGWVGPTAEDLKPTLYDEADAKLQKTKGRNEKTGVVKQEYIHAFEKVLSKYKSYFDTAPSQFYFDDMNSKNVIIKEGKFNGLIDLDWVTYGDYLEAIGRIKTSWYGTTYGDYYTEAVMRALELNEKQREIVTVWALINRIFWQGEIGIQFNQNTSTEIDPERVEVGNKVIDGLIKELNL